MTTLPATLRRTRQLTTAAATRVRLGRPGRLTARIAGTLTLAAFITHSGAGPGPVTGTLTGLLTWTAVTARGDIAPPQAGPES